MAAQPSVSDKMQSQDRRIRKDAVAAPERKHPVDETLPPLKMFTSGLQHVAAMYAGVVAPPMIVGPAVGLTAKETAFLMGASLFTAGIATLLQTLGFWKIGARLPFVNGVSFAGVTPMIAIGKDRGADAHRRHLRRDHRRQRARLRRSPRTSANWSASSRPSSPAPSSP